MENKFITEFSEYFKEDLDAISEELEKSKTYSKIIDDEITKLTDNEFMSKGSQHYLIEHINNAVQLQTQRQGLRKDRFAIKKTILDYASKAEKSEENPDDQRALMENIQALLSKDRQEHISIVQDDSSSDAEIERILNNNQES